MFSIRACAEPSFPVRSATRFATSGLGPDLLPDDFGLRRFTARQSRDYSEVIIERHRRASTIITSNGAIEEWIPPFDDPILA